MPPLTAIERFFERLFERPSARIFRARLQPVQLQRRIERAMEAERLAAADRTLVPNRFVVHLHPADLAAFGDMTTSLASELADGALLFARARRYTLVDRPRVDLLADEGADLKRVIVGHSNGIANDLPFMRTLMDRGAYVQFDLLGKSPTVRTRLADSDVAAGIVEMIKAGYVEKILLSQDVCTKLQLKAYGGSGYSYIVEYFLPYLKRLGVTDAHVHTIMVENPRRVLTFVEPAASQATR